MAGLEASLQQLPSAQQQQALADSQRRTLAELGKLQAAIQAQEAAAAHLHDAAKAAAKTGDGPTGSAKAKADRAALDAVDELLVQLQEQQERLEKSVAAQFAKLGDELRAAVQADLKQAAGELHKGFARLAADVKSAQSQSAKELVSACSLLLVGDACAAQAELCGVGRLRLLAKSATRWKPSPSAR